MNDMTTEVFSEFKIDVCQATSWDQEDESRQCCESNERNCAVVNQTYDARELEECSDTLQDFQLPEEENITSSQGA